VCVVLCAVFRLIVVLFYVMCVIYLLRLSVVSLPPCKNPLAFKINNEIIINAPLALCGGDDRLITSQQEPVYTISFSLSKLFAQCRDTQPQFVTA
jgi:hypothetical protein